MSNDNDKSDTPEAPPEVAARQGKARALNATTAQLVEIPTVLGEDGRIVGTPEQQNARHKACHKRAETFVGGTPHRGLDSDIVARISGMTYEDAPKMDPVIGDRTPAFVNWLYKTHPNDAKVRYAYRNIWPTELPANWPPASALLQGVQQTKPQNQAKRGYRRKADSPATE